MRPLCRPKNVLHHNGIPQTVADINATLPRTLAIVDGVHCMEGDGPILGSMKPMGLVVVGAELPAVDATVARIMGLEDYGLRVGAKASMVVLDAGNPIEALRLRPDRLCVVAKGRVISRQQRNDATLSLPGRPASVRRRHAAHS